MLPSTAVQVTVAVVVVTFRMLVTNGFVGCAEVELLIQLEVTDVELLIQLEGVTEVEFSERVDVIVEVLEAAVVEFGQTEDNEPVPVLDDEFPSQ